MKSDPSTWLDNYGDILFRYALIKTGNTSTAEDLVQETLIAALKNQATFKQQSSEKTWLIGILKHKVIDHYRKTSRDLPLQQEPEGTHAEQDLFDETGHWRHHTSPWDNPEQIIEDQAFLQVLEDCIDKLPPQHAELFMLSEFRDISSDSLCKLLAISSTNNMWVLLSRIRARLRQCLDQHWFNQ